VADTENNSVNPVEYVLTWRPLVDGEPVDVPLWEFITGLEDELGEFRLYKRQITADGVTKRPVLRRVDCGKGCPVTWAEADDNAPGGCPWCFATYYSAAHSQCDHRGHGRWRSSGVVKWLASKAYSLGLVAAYGHQYGGGCPGCLSGARWLGRRSYVLGWSVDNWRCLLRGRHWPGDQVDGLCAKCAPCPTCGSRKASHNPGCADDAWACGSREDGAGAVTPTHGGGT
jgi:hypothetical protein